MEYEVVLLHGRNYASRLHNLGRVLLAHLRVGLLQKCEECLEFLLRETSMITLTNGKHGLYRQCAPSLILRHKVTEIQGGPDHGPYLVQHVGQLLREEEARSLQRKVIHGLVVVGNESIELGDEGNC